MKLGGITKGAGLRHRLRLSIVGLVHGEPPSDVVRALFYRPELFGAPIGHYCHALLRGQSEWTLGERELFAAFVSHCNNCEFCTTAHRAVAERALGQEVVAAVLQDFRTAPVSEPMRVVLAFLERLSKDPMGVDEAAVKRVLAEGVSAPALETALHISVVFNVINRVADALGFDIPPASIIAKEAEFLIKMGYRPMPI